MILRRWLTYEDVDVAQIEKKQGESLADILRPAARHWAFAHGEVIGGLSTPRKVAKETSVRKGLQA